MAVVATINTKGGAGKTTFTLNLGLFLQRAGQRITFFDLDDQGSLSDWIRRRPESLPKLCCHRLRFEQLEGELRAARHQQGYILLDTPGSLRPEEVHYLIQTADQLVIPALLSPVDSSALTRFCFTLAATAQQAMIDKTDCVSGQSGSPPSRNPS